MTSQRFLAILTFTIVILMGGCRGQSQNNASSSLDNHMSQDNHPDEDSSEIIYFSYDKGLSWENKSDGLPSSTSIALGGIAVSGNKLALISKDSGLYYFEPYKNKWVHIPTPQQLMTSNVGALQFFNHEMYVGTQTNGVFYSGNEGKTWSALNGGLDNLTIRKFAVIDHILYVATNSGLYSYQAAQNKWDLEYGKDSPQVNGITSFDGNICIATSQGAFSSPIGRKDWKKIYSNGALHNISSDEKTLYAMVYNELFSSHDKGQTWQNIQNGLPSQLYTFNVMNVDNTLLAGQWDGVYRKEKESESWEYSGKGLPSDLAIANMVNYNGIIVVSGNVRKLKNGMTTDK